MSVEVTPFAYLVIPTTLLMLFVSPRLLIPWAIMLAPFQAASVLNIDFGGFPIGIQPGQFAAVVLIASLFLELLQKGYIWFPRNLVFIYVPLFIFAICAALSAFFLPRIFEGAVEVYPARLDTLGSSSIYSADKSTVTPLHPVATNISQGAQIFFLTILAVAVSLKVRAAPGTGPRMDRAYAIAYFLAGFLVVFIGFYQLSAQHFGFPYPTDLLYSNPGYIQHYEQTIGTSIKRLSSTFPEPSLLAFYLVGVFSFSVWLYLYSPRFRLISLLFCIASGAGLLLTTSTTAYIALGIITLFMFSQVISRQGSLTTATRLAVIAISIVVVGIGALFVFYGSGALDRILQSTLFAKSSSTSYSIRTKADLYSLYLLVQTWGFGVGWGSNRSSSLFTNMLGNAGLLGSALFAWFVIRVCKRASKAVKRTSINKEQRRLIEAFGVSSLAMLVSAALSVPDLTFVSFWLNVGVLIGLILRAEKTVYRPKEILDPALTASRRRL